MSIEDKFKAEISTLEGKTQEDFAAALGYWRKHVTVIVGVIALVVGLIVGWLIHR